MRDYLLAPLLSEASIHANTPGIFKGFYKDQTGIGCFGGRNKNALSRILGKIELRAPIFSRFTGSWDMCCTDANELARSIGSVDIAYLDPPYNQHPYGSNYFMLNLLTQYKAPKDISRVSGIPANWNRSAYNSSRQVEATFSELIHSLKARFIVISYNDEGLLSPDLMMRILKSRGQVHQLKQSYQTFRGSRNLRNRRQKVQEQLFIVSCT